MLPLHAIANRSMCLAIAVNNQIDQAKVVSIEDVRALAASVAQLSEVCRSLSANMKLANDMLEIFANQVNAQAAEGPIKSLRYFERIDPKMNAALLPALYREWLTEQIRLQAGEGPPDSFPAQFETGE